MLKELYYYLLGYRWKSYLIITYHQRESDRFQILTKIKDVDFLYRPIMLIGAKGYRRITITDELEIKFNIEYNKASFVKHTEEFLTTEI